MDVINQIRAKAKSSTKVIVLPEYNDARIQQAAKVIEEEGIAKVVVLSPDKIPSDKKRIYIEEFYRLRKSKVPGLDIKIVERIFEDTLYSAAIMTRLGEVDGFVAGASHTTADMARAAIYCLEVDSLFGYVCSSFIMIVPDCRLGENGLFIFADCGIIPEPNPSQLAAICLASVDLGRKVLNLLPRVAFLSYSTHGSSRDKIADKIKEALEIVKSRNPDLLVDGELQVDAAIVPEVAHKKYPNSPLGGRANILIFPNLEAGNISYKLVERLAKARALGPLIMGTTKPCSDLSRGCSVEDIVDVVAITSIRAQAG